MKNVAKNLIVCILSSQVKRLRKKNAFIVVGVAGSVGKTSTKFAIASMLEVSKKVRYQKGNYNDITSVPLVFFGLETPSIYNPLAWLGVFLKIEKQLAKPYSFDVVVVELGTDGPGQIKLFQKYLQLDIGVLTAICPEHMEFFNDMDEVAAEESTIGLLSKKLIVSRDMIDKEYLTALKGCLDYSLHSTATYQLTDVLFANGSYTFSLKYNGVNIINSEYKASSEVQLYSICAAMAVSHELDFTVEQITDGLKNIKSVPGRMNLLEGIKNSVIIDDTYNANPTSMKAALDALYSKPAVQKIAILGNMNELGKYSADAHTEIGNYCNPKELELVVTIGPDANEYLAAAAEKRGCKVRRYTNPYKAGAELQEYIKKGSIVLVKGSQNRVFAEEAVKLLLADSKDAKKLVRQSREWLYKKHKIMSEIK